MIGDQRDARFSQSRLTDWGLGCWHPKISFFPPRLPRSLCGVRRESSRGFHKFAGFVKAPGEAGKLFWIGFHESIMIIKAEDARLRKPTEEVWARREEFNAPARQEEE